MGHLSLPEPDCRQGRRGREFILRRYRSLHECDPEIRRQVHTLKSADHNCGSSGVHEQLLSSGGIQLDIKWVNDLFHKESLWNTHRGYLDFE